MAWSDVVNNLASNMAGITNSYVQTGSQILNSAPNISNYSLTSNDLVLFDFLKNWSFVAGMRDIIVSTIKEALVTTDFAVSVADKNREDIVKVYNDRLKKMNFKSRVMESLDDIVYRGSFLVGITEDGKRIFDVRDPYDFKVVKKKNHVVGYLYKGRYIPHTNAVGYWYKIGNAEILSDSKAKKKKIPLDDQLEAYEIGISTFSGYGVFQALLQKLYQAYIQEYMLYQLGLRESIKPQILSMVISGNRTNITQATNAADNIERLLNQSGAALNSAVDPINFLNQVTFFLLNNIRVVPQIDTFSSLSDISVDNLSDRRRQLSDELEDNKKQSLNTIGIPDELFSGSSNKWEVMSRNDRYATLANNHLTAIASMTKRAVISLAAKDGIVITEDELIFNLEVSSFLATYESKSKLSALSDKLRELESLVQTISSLYDNQAIVKDSYKEFIMKQLGNLDADLVHMIELKDPESEPRDEMSELPESRGLPGGHRLR